MVVSGRGGAGRAVARVSLPTEPPEAAFGSAPAGDGRVLPGRAAAAVRYLEQALAEIGPGKAVPLQGKATLEVWTESDARGVDADLAILECGTEVAALCPATGVSTPSLPD